MRVLAVVNKAAGGLTEEFVDPLEAAPEVELNVVWTGGPDDGTRCAADGVAASGPDLVVSVGGDGTAAEVARGLTQTGKSPPPLLIAPAGTGNSNFRGLWNDLPWPEVVATVFGERRYAVRRMDVIHLAELDCATLLGVSAGMIPECLEAARSLPMAGRQKLVAAAVQVLDNYTAYPARVTVDDQALCECATLLIVVGGVRYRGGLLELLPQSVLDDGLLDVCVVDAAEVAPQELGASALSGDLTSLNGVHYGRGREVRLERLDGAPMKLEHDGELHTGSHTGYRVSAVSGPFTVVVPDPAPTCFASEQRSRKE